MSSKFIVSIVDMTKELGIGAFLCCLGAAGRCYVLVGCRYYVFCEGRFGIASRERLFRLATPNDGLSGFSYHEKKEPCKPARDLISIVRSAHGFFCHSYYLLELARLQQQTKDLKLNDWSVTYFILHLNLCY